MKKRSFLFIMFLFVAFLLMACSENESDENDNDNEMEEPVENEESPEEETESDEAQEEEEVPALTEDKAVQVLNDYRTTFMEVVENTDDEGALENYETKEELKSDFRTVMSESLAESYMSTYFEEEDGALFVVATEAPVWFEEDQDYSFEQISDTEFEIIQEQSNNLIGNMKMTYVLTLENENWIVSEVRSEEQTSNNNESNEQNQESSSGEEEANGEITESRAEGIVREHLNIGQNSDLKIVMDHKNDEGNFVVQVYEVVTNGDTSHTATLGWYIVDKEDGSVEEMM